MLEPLGDFARQHRAGGAVDVADLALDLDHRLAGLERRHGLLDQLAVENIVDRMVLALRVQMDRVRRRIRLVENAG